MFRIFPCQEQGCAKSLSKPQYKNFGACQNRVKISSPKTKQTKMFDFDSNLEFNTFGWNLFAYLQTESEV